MTNGTINFNVFWMLVVYSIVVGAVLISHVFILYMSKTYDKKREYKKEKWLERFDEAFAGDRRLGSRSIRKLRNNLELSAFTAAVSEDRHGTELLVANQAAICDMARKLRQSDMRAYFAWLLQEHSCNSEITPIE